MELKPFNHRRKKQEGHRLRSNTRYQIPENRLREAVAIWESDPSLSWEDVGERMGYAGGSLHQACLELKLLEPPEGMKRCIRCRQVQDIEQFGKVRNRESRRRICKSCRAANERARYQGDAEDTGARNQLMSHFPAPGNGGVESSE